MPAKPIAKAANALPVEANKAVLSEAKKTEAGADANKAVDPEVQRLEELKKTLENKIAEYRKNPPLAGKEGPEQYKVSTEWFLENGQKALAQNNTPPDKYLSRQFRMDKDGFYSANTDNQLRNLFEKIGVKI